MIWLLFAVLGIFSMPGVARAATARDLYVITPCRIYDSRVPGNSPQGPLSPGIYSMNLPEPGRCGVPTDAVALIVNATIVSDKPAAGAVARTGYLSLYQGGTTPPGAGVSVFKEGAILGQFIVVKLGTRPAPDIGFQIYTSIAKVQVVIDVLAYSGSGTPSATTLDTASVAENQPAGALVGRLSTNDPDFDDVPLYSLVTGTGDTDNSKFQISGNQLLTTAAFDYETQETYSVRVRTRDQFSGVFFETVFAVTATDVDEAPTNLSIDSTAVSEGLPAGTLVGTLSTTDPDTADSFTYSLVSGPLGPDNGSFQISGNQLLTNAVFDRETKASYTIYLRTTDSGSLTFEKQLTITVADANDPPAPSGGPFSLAENSGAGTVVGTVAANDPDVGQSHTFVITGGNTGGAFAINATTGALTVATPSVLDFETAPTFSLTVLVTDDGSPVLSGSTGVVINLMDVNEPPVVSGGPFSVAENSPAGTVVGTATAGDPDAGQSSTFAITGGNSGGAFAIHPTTGQITVTTPSALDFETTPIFSLTIQATDNGSPARSGSATVTINLTNVNEAPAPSGGPFSIAENSASGTSVGTVTHGDPDSGQSHTFAITGGNTGSAFAINAATGILTVSNSAALNFETTPSFSLTVQVTDNGSPALSGSTTVVINLTDVNEAPAPNGGPFSIAENSPAGTSLGTIVANDPDSGQSHTFAITAGNTGGAFAINPATGQITVATPSALDFETTPTFNLTVQATDNGSPVLSGSATVVVNLMNANDPPVVSGGLFAIPENSVNGTSVGSATFTDQDTGQSHTFAITAGNTGGAFIINSATGLIQVANSAAVNFEATPVFNLTVRVTDGGSPPLAGTATVTINLSNVAEAPVANDEGSPGSPYVETVGNTLLEVTSTPSATGPKITFTGNIFANDFDPDGPTAFTVTLDSSTSGAVVTLNNDGTFTYVPPAGFSGLDNFTYRVTDPTSLYDTATVYINVEGRVWYVRNDATAGGLGRSTDPFDTLAEAETASGAGDTIYLFEGDGTTLGQSDGITLKSGQRLIGEMVPLTMPSVNINGVVGPTLRATTGDRPKIENDSTPDAPGEDNGVNVPATSGNATGVEVRGLDIAGFDNAIDVTVAGSKTASVTIRDNVISGSGAEGIDVNDSSSGTVTLAIHDNTVTAGGNAIDIQRTAGTAWVTAFDDNVVTGSTAGTGINVSGALFDASPGGSFDTVSGGVTVIGAPGDGVGQSGLVLSGVEGDLSFSNLDIFADGGAGLSASSFTDYTGSAGLRITATGGTAIVEAISGPAVNVDQADLHLDLASLKSTSSPSTGVSLTGVTGSFAAGSGSSITNITSSGGTAFLVDGSNAVITYPGSISTSNGTGVSLAANTGSTISFSGPLTLATGTHPAFTATGGGTVTATDPSSTLATTVATALNVVDTTIGAGGLKFRSISSNGGGSSGIVLSNTGTAGGLTVSGAGGTCTTAASCSGGAIQNKGVDGISLVNTQGVSLSNLFIDNNDGSGIFGDQLTGFSLANSVVSNNGDSVGGTEAGLRFNKLLGSCAITNTTVSGSSEDEIRITPASGVLSNLAVTTSTIGPNNPTTGGNGITLAPTGTADVTLTVTGGVFQNLRGSALQASGDGNTRRTVRVSGATFRDNNRGVYLLGSGSGDLTFDLSENAFLRHALNPIQIATDTTSTHDLQLVGKASSNVIGDGTLDSGAKDLYGIAVDLQGDVDAILSLTSNAVSNTNLDGIYVQTRLDNDGDAEIGRLDLTLRGNDVNTPDDNGVPPVGSSYGTRVESRNTTTVCLDIAGNASAGVGGLEEFRTSQLDASTFILERLTDGDGTPSEVITSMPAVESFLAGQNDAGSTADATQQTVTTGYTEAADGFCRKPQ